MSKRELQLEALRTTVGERSEGAARSSGRTAVAQKAAEERLANRLVAELIAASPPDGRLRLPNVAQLVETYGEDEDTIIAACVRLRRRGLLTVEPDRAVYLETNLFGIPPEVVDLVPAEARPCFAKDLLHIYVSNLSLMIEMGVRGATAAHRGLIQDAVDRIAAASSAEVEDATCKAIETFTSTLGLACGNPLFVMLHNQLEAVWSRLGPRLFASEPPGEVLSVLTRFLEHANAGEPEAATLLVVDTVIRCGTLALLHGSAGGPQPPPALLN